VLWDIIIEVAVSGLGSGMCAVLYHPVLDRYPLHSYRIHTHWKMTSLNKCSTAFYNLWHPSTFCLICYHLTICFCPIASVRPDLLTGCIISSFHNMSIVWACLGLFPFSGSYNFRKKVGMQWKRNKVPLKEIEVPLMENCS